MVDKTIPNPEVPISGSVRACGRGGSRGQGRGRGYRWGHSSFQHRDSTQAAATESRETSRDGNVWIVISSDDAPRGRLNSQNVLSEVSRLITLFATSGGTRISGLGG